jgi:hypothetical protein
MTSPLSIQRKHAVSSLLVVVDWQARANGYPFGKDEKEGLILILAVGLRWSWSRQPTCLPAMARGEALG